MLTENLYFTIFVSLVSGLLSSVLTLIIQNWKERKKDKKNLKTKLQLAKVGLKNNSILRRNRYSLNEISTLLDSNEIGEVNENLVSLLCNLRDIMRFYNEIKIEEQSNSRKHNEIVPQVEATLGIEVDCFNNLQKKLSPEIFKASQMLDEELNSLYLWSTLRKGTKYVEILLNFFKIQFMKNFERTKNKFSQRKID